MLSEGTVAHATLKLPFDPSTPGEARASLERFLSERTVDADLVDHALIVVSELVANALQHGSPDARGRMRIDVSLDERRLLVSVWDAGEATALIVSDPAPDATDGRGLLIIDRVSKRWSVDRRDGTRVSVELSIA